MRHLRVWLDASCTPGRIPGQTLITPATSEGRQRPGSVANAKAGKAAWRADWRVLPSSAPARRATPLAFGGTGKETGRPRPSEVRDRQSVGFFRVGFVSRWAV